MGSTLKLTKRGFHGCICTGGTLFGVLVEVLMTAVWGVGVGVVSGWFLGAASWCRCFPFYEYRCFSERRRVQLWGEV